MSRYPCPSCHQHSISFFRKWLSYPAFPAICRECRQYCLVAKSSATDILLASIALLIFSGLAAALLRSGLALFTGTVLILAFYFWRWHKVELHAVSENLVAQARKRDTLLFGLLALLGLLQ